MATGGFRGRNTIGTCRWLRSTPMSRPASQDTCPFEIIEIQIAKAGSSFVLFGSRSIRGLAMPPRPRFPDPNVRLRRLHAATPMQSTTKPAGLKQIPHTYVLSGGGSAISFEPASAVSADFRCRAVACNWRVSISGDSRRRLDAAASVSELCRRHSHRCASDNGFPAGDSARSGSHYFGSLSGWMALRDLDGGQSLGSVRHDKTVRVERDR